MKTLVCSLILRNKRFFSLRPGSHISLLFDDILTSAPLRPPSVSDVVSLDGGGSSSLVYRWSPAPRRTSRDVISLKFKTLRNSGTLLHAEGERGLGLSLGLERGQLQLLLTEGTAQQILTVISTTHLYKYLAYLQDASRMYGHHNQIYL